VVRWTAPVATHPVNATVRVPGSKSMTNRALVLSALATGASQIRRPLRSRDTELMAAALRALGASVDDTGHDWAVIGRDFTAPSQPIDVGNAGTVARFVPPIAALAPGEVRLDGDPRIRERPLAPLVTALRALGVPITASSADGLPLTVAGAARVRGGAVRLDASQSSQFVSGLLLAAPRYVEGVAVTHVGPPVPSAPHLDMTVAMLRAAGVRVDSASPDEWRVEPGGLTAREWLVEPDLSSAAPFLAAAAATAGQVRIADWPSSTMQPGARLVELLTSMGATTQLDDSGLLLIGPDQLLGVDADLHDSGELTPVVAALAALATTPSRLSGIAHLRQHETDRLAALAKQITALGGDVAETSDGIVINPRALRGGQFSTYDDHRMAMAAAVLGLRTPGVVLDDVATTDKTLPGFATMWDDMLHGPEPVS
jgi:3-phosphoshikimate 1-carboxyvinyltransferase